MWRPGGPGEARSLVCCVMGKARGTPTEHLGFDTILAHDILLCVPRLMPVSQPGKKKECILLRCCFGWPG